MKIEPAINLGASCTYLQLDTKARVSYDRTPLGVEVWDLEAGKHYILTWVLSIDVDFRTQETEPNIVRSDAPVSPAYKAIFDDETLALRDFYISPEEKETIESELAYREAIGEAKGSIRGMRQVPLKFR